MSEFLDNAIRVVELTNQDKPHMERYIKSLQALDFYINTNAKVLELGGVTAFTKALGGYPIELNCTFDHDLREPLWPAFPRDHYDIVLMMEVIEHLKDRETSRVDEYAASGIKMCLQSARAALRPGGLLFLTTPNVTCWRSFQLLAQGKHPYMYQPHQRELSPRDVRDRLEEAGFKVEKVEAVDVWRRHGVPTEQVVAISEMIASCGGNPSPKLRGDCLFVLARRPL